MLPGYMSAGSGRGIRGELNRYKTMQQEGNLIIFGPLYSYYDIASEARTQNAATHALPAGDYSWYSAGIGQLGLGFNRAVTICETNLEGKGGTMPGGFDFVGQSAGVIYPSTLPVAVKDNLDRWGSVIFDRHEFRWRMGKTALWPSGEFHHQSKSASTTIANQLVQYGVNGAVSQRWFPADGELLFPRNQIIRFDLHTCAEFFVTVDGLTANGGVFGEDPGGNEIPNAYGALVGFSMEGFKFTLLAP